MNAMSFIFRREFSLARLCKQNLASFSSIVPNVQVKQKDDLRTNKSNPDEHTKADIGLFYEIPYELASTQLFLHGGWRNNYARLCKTFRESCVMIRHPALEIMHYLRHTDFSLAINKYVVYGKRGTGKSLTLTHLIHYAYLKGWCLFHVPAVEYWLLNKSDAIISYSRPDSFELNKEAAQWLLHFRTQNYELLSKENVQLLNDHTWNIKQTSKAGESILSLIDFGIANQKLASEVILALAEELKQLSSSGRIRTLVCIDGVNLFFFPKSNIRNPEKEYIPLAKVSFISAFLSMLQPNWCNGAAVVLCDGIPPEKSVGLKDGYDGAPLWYNESELPMHQLSRKGFEFLFPFIPIEVLPFSRMETINMLNYYRDRRWLGRSDGDEELIALSCGNGRELMKICAPLF